MRRRRLLSPGVPPPTEGAYAKRQTTPRTSWGTKRSKPRLHHDFEHPARPGFAHATVTAAADAAAPTIPPFPSAYRPDKHSPLAIESPVLDCTALRCTALYFKSQYNCLFTALTFRRQYDDNRGDILAVPFERLNVCSCGTPFGASSGGKHTQESRSTCFASTAQHAARAVSRLQRYCY